MIPRTMAARGRKATGGKGSGVLAPLLLIALWTPCGVVMSEAFLENTHRGFGTLTVERSLGSTTRSGHDAHRGPTQRFAEERPPAPGSVRSTEEMVGLTFVVGFLLWLCFIGELFLRDLSATDSDLEWIASLPVGPISMFGYRMLMRAIPRESDVLLLGLMTGCLAYDCGWSMYSPAVAGLVTLPLLCLLGGIHAVLEPTLRTRIGPDSRYYLQRMMSLLLPLTATPIYFFLLALGDPTYRGVVAPAVDLILELPKAILWTPPGLVVRAIASARLSLAVPYLAYLAGWVAVSWTLGAVLLRQVLSRGITSSGLRESTRTEKVSVRSRPRVVRPRRILSPFQAHVLRAFSGRGSTVGRMPLILLLIAAIAKFWPQQSMERVRELCAEGLGTPARSGIFAIFLGSVLLPQTAMLFHRDGPALWLLTTVPRSLESLLREGCWLSAIVAGTATGLAMLLPLGLWLPLSTEAVAVFIYVVVVSALLQAILVYLLIPDSNPYATLASERINTSTVVIHSYLAQIFWLAILGEHWWTRLVNLLIGALIFLAARQRALDELPYFLDPVASPPRRVTLLHGLIFTQFFFVGQTGLRMFIGPVAPALSPAASAAAYLFGGILSYGLACWFFRRHGITDRPQILPESFRAALSHGIRGGVFAAAGGIVYLRMLFHLGRGSALLGHGENMSTSILLTVLTVVPDPIFEEFLFRGLVYRGMQKILGVRAALVLSALTFAALHPPTSFLPVFGLGICTALAYERTGSLLSPMITHGLYNLAVDLVTFFA